MSDDTNLQCSACVYQNYPCMGRFCELGVKLWLEWKVDKMPKWKPNFGDEYYIPCVSFGMALADCKIWLSTADDITRHGAGIVFRTRKEALGLAEKMLAVAKERVENE